MFGCVTTSCSFRAKTKIVAVDNSRFAKGPLMQCSSALMKKVYAAIMDSMDIEPVYTWRG